MDTGTKQVIENANKRDSKYREMVEEKSIETRILELCDEYSNAPLEAFTEKNSQFYALFKSRMWLATLLKAYIQESQPVDKEKSLNMMDALILSDQMYEKHLLDAIGKKPDRWL